MVTDPTNIEKIIKEINKSADTAVVSLKKETADYIRRELKKAEKQAKQEITAAQFSELDKLNEQNNTDLSVSEKNETQALLRRRSEITEEVFSEAARRIEEFTQSEKYLPLLIASAKELKKVLGDGSIFYVRPSDEKYAPALSAFCAEVRTDNFIVLGGIRAESAEMGLNADDTLDSRLSLRRQEFYENSGLSVTM